jgi:hypothetical protein
LFQNLVVDIVEVETLGGIVLLGGDFNARTATLLNTIDISDLCELLQMPKFIETKQPNVVAKQQNRDTIVGGWGCELLNLCCDIGLLILNGRTPNDKSREFTCLAIRGRITIDYIVSSPVVWQGATHFEVIINDTRYCAMRGDSDHKLLCLQLNIDYSFVKPQHTIETKKFLPRFPRFKYDKLKAKEYQFAITTSLENLWVVDLIEHLGADGLTDLLKQRLVVAAEFTFGNKPSGGSCRERHCHKPWFDIDCRTMKCELKL